MHQEYPEATLQECIDYAIEREHCALVDEVNTALNVAEDALERLVLLALQHNRSVSDPSLTPGRYIEPRAVDGVLRYCRWIFGEIDLSEHPTKEELADLDDHTHQICLTRTANSAVTLATTKIERLQEFTSVRDLEMINFEIQAALRLRALLDRIIESTDHQ